MQALGRLRPSCSDSEGQEFGDTGGIRAGSARRYGPELEDGDGVGRPAKGVRSNLGQGRLAQQPHTEQRCMCAMLDRDPESLDVSDSVVLLSTSDSQQLSQK